MRPHGEGEVRKHVVFSLIHLLHPHNAGAHEAHPIALSAGREGLRNQHLRLREPALAWPAHGIPGRHAHRRAS